MKSSSTTRQDSVTQLLTTLLLMSRVGVYLMYLVEPRFVLSLSARRTEASTRVAMPMQGSLRRPVAPDSPLPAA